MSKRRGRTASGALLAVLVLASCTRPDTTSIPSPPQSNPTTQPASDDLPLWFAFGLRRDQAGLQRAVADISNPGAGRYGSLLSMQEVARRFGAKKRAIRSVEKALSAAGFTGGHDATGGLVVGTFTAAQASTFFGQDFVVDGSTVSPSTQVQIPGSLSSHVTEVFGGYATVPVPVSPAPTNAPTCPSAPSEPPLRFAKDAYGLSSLADQGLTGSGVRVGLLEIDSYAPTALDAYRNCTGASGPAVDVVSANADPGQLRQSSQESTLDVDVLAAIAPGVSARLVQYDAATSVVFPLDEVLQGQLEGTTAVDLLSVSTGFCASSVADQERTMAEWQLMTLAATGVTTVVAAGDTGSSGCYPSDQAAGVWYPSESPNVLSVGGTQFAGQPSNSATYEVWHSSQQQVAGGGGPSIHFALPDYQQSAGLQGQYRQTPDVAFLASPSDVGPVLVCDPGDACAWTQVAGTSASAPGVAAGLALLLEGPLQARGRLGLLNPALYEAASANPGHPAVMDITSGNNDLFGVGCCTAAPGYDMASGWGSLDFTAVPAALGN